MIIVTKIKNSKKFNLKLLELIKLINNPHLSQDSDIFNTDFFLPQQHERKYLSYFYEIIRPYLNKIALDLNSEKWIIHNTWFQQYLNSNYHDWHTHSGCQFTNVYFVELPDKSLITEIFNNKKINLNEGDLLTFPSYLYHRSPINSLNKRKTIISFNSSFHDFNKQA